MQDHNNVRIQITLTFVGLIFHVRLKLGEMTPHYDSFSKDKVVWIEDICGVYPKLGDHTKLSFELKMFLPDLRASFFEIEMIRNK